MQPEWIGQSNPLDEQDAEEYTEFFFGEWLTAPELVERLNSDADGRGAFEIHEHCENYLYIRVPFENGE